MTASVKRIELEFPPVVGAMLPILERVARSAAQTFSAKSSPVAMQCPEYFDRWIEPVRSGLFGLWLVNRYKEMLKSSFQAGNVDSEIFAQLEKPSRWFRVVLFNGDPATGWIVEGELLAVVRHNEVFDHWRFPSLLGGGDLASPQSVRKKARTKY